MGGFAEGDLGITAHAVGYARLDFFNPSTTADANQLVRGTFGMLFWQPMVSIVPEISLTRTGDATDAGLVVHARITY